MRGKGYGKNSGGHKYWDHPRLCGEKPTHDENIFSWGGSPPPMRGKAWNLFLNYNSFRITPAYAGKSFQHVESFKINRDHPRLCGEKALNGFSFTYLLGSPPPMRGKEFEFHLPYLQKRITPAYAGKRTTMRSTQSAIKDHPRLCGEKFLPSAGNSPVTGSPPPMRGKACMRGDRQRFVGITPAYAGKSVHCRPLFCTGKDHPRLCGEKA